MTTESISTALALALAVAWGWYLGVLANRRSRATQSGATAGYALRDPVVKRFLRGVGLAVAALLIAV